VYKRFGKRLFDLLAFLPLAIVAFPIIILASLLSYCFLGPPVLFAQLRAGRDGRPFLLFKFRSMTNARDARGELLPDAKRLTFYGHFLRTTSLDELPSLWNLLRGEISLVGPRPLPVRYLQRYSPRHMLRHTVKPGITGWAQVNGRNALDWEQKFELDVWYTEHLSLPLDLKILWMTIFKVIARDGINQRDHVTMPEFIGVSPTDMKDGAS